MNELKWDLSITISAIIAVAAIISPILTAVINNVHQRNMKKLELKEKHYSQTASYQKEIFENYLRKTENISVAHLQSPVLQWNMMKPTLPLSYMHQATYKC